MSCDFRALCVGGIAKLSPYQPGKPVEELERELGISDIVKLASNENPMGPGPRARDAMMSLVHDQSRYPDGNGFELKQALSAHLGVATACLVLGNGSNDVLELVARTFVSAAHEVVFSQHAFAVYPLVTQAIGARAMVTPAVDWGHDLDAMVDAITADTRLVFVANPNNPTGTWVNEDSLKRFLERVPDHVIVVVDEAYFEYVTEPEYPNSLIWRDEYPNLVVCRTFSKVHGLAGLRVGYAVADVQVADLMNRVRQPFNVNSLGLAAAKAALEDTTFVENSIALNTKERANLSQALIGLKLECIPSVGNFVSFKAPIPAAELYEKLLRQGVIVRPVDAYGMPDFLRVTVGLESENKRFLSALETVLAK